MTESSRPKSMGTDWQRLGDIELPVGSPPDGALYTWLTELLAPLSLHAEFLNQVLRSAQDSMARALQPNGEIKFGHVHLSILKPQAVEGKTWGFFRIEKIEGTEQHKQQPDHTVEVYLYVEG